MVETDAGNVPSARRSTRAKTHVPPADGVLEKHHEKHCQDPDTRLTRFEMYGMHTASNDPKEQCGKEYQHKKRASLGATLARTRVSPAVPNQLLLPVPLEFFHPSEQETKNPRDD